MKRTLRSDMEQMERRLGLTPCQVRERLLRTLDEIDTGDDDEDDDAAALSLREEQQPASALAHKRP